MTMQDLEQQLLKLDPVDRLRIIQSVIQSLIPNSTNDAPQNANISVDLTYDRSPDHPLRSLPLSIPADFDEPND